MFSFVLSKANARGSLGVKFQLQQINISRVRAKRLTSQIWMIFWAPGSTRRLDERSREQQEVARVSKKNEMKEKSQNKIRAESSRCLRMSDVMLGLGFFGVFCPEIDFRGLCGAFTCWGTQNRSKSRSERVLVGFFLEFSAKKTHLTKMHRSRPDFKIEGRH